MARPGRSTGLSFASWCSPAWREWREHETLQESEVAPENGDDRAAKKIASATRTLVEFDILSPKRGSVIMRSLAASDPAQTRF